MLFDEAELSALDKVAKKNEINTVDLTQKPALKIKHWIGVSNCGRLDIFTNRTNKEYVYFVETESFDIAQQLLNAIPKALMRGIYVVPKWNSSPMSLFYSPYNFHLCAIWLNEAIQILGYEKRNTYTIIEEPSDLANKLKQKTTPQDNSSSKFVEDTLRTLKEKVAQDELDRQKAFQEKLQAMKKRHALAQQESQNIGYAE